MAVEIKKSSMIRRNGDGSSNKHLWLSNIDLLFGDAFRPFLYLYKPQNECCSKFFNAKVLKDALKVVLVQFSPVAGRLERDENGRIQINCDGEGVLFVEAETDCDFSNINDFTPREQLLPFVPMTDFSKHISSYPLLLVQLTKFKCGGVCLGIGWHHILADAYGFLHFVRTWANTARGLPIDVLPSLDRTILRSRNPPTPTFQHPEYGIFSTVPNPKPASLIILKITPDKLKILKARLPGYTTVEILTAHAWRCATKARGLPNNQPSAILFTVNGRSRLSPPAPAHYFGNLVLHPTSTVSCGELVSEPLEHTVERIHKAIKRVDDEYIRSAIDHLEQQEDLSNVGVRLQKVSKPNFKIVSWLNLPFYDVDFGWGKPIYFRAQNVSEGKGNIVANPGDNGTLLLSICLETQCLSSFEKLFYNFISDAEISRM